MCIMTQLNLIGTRDCASLLGVTRAHINRLVSSDELPIVGKIGKRGINVFDRDRIEEIVAEQEATATC